MKAEEARTLAYRLKGEVMVDIYPTHLRVAETVSDICEAYISRFQKDWKTGQAERYLRKFVLPTFADTQGAQP